MKEKKERNPVLSWCAYTSFLKERLGRRLTREECSEIMQLYIKATPVKNTLRELEDK